MRRETLDALRKERADHVRALLANGGYLFNGQDGMKMRQQEIAKINEHFDRAIESYTDPGKKARQQFELENNPFFAASLRAKSVLHWDLNQGVRQA